MSEQNNRYVGTVVNCDATGHFGFVELRSLTLDGRPHGLDTDGDIFVHQDDLVAHDELRDGMGLGFEVTPDVKRGGKKLRARNASEILEAELIPSNEQPVPGLVVMAPLDQGISESVTALALRRNRLIVHRWMKDVPLPSVDKAIENKPLEGVPHEVGTSEELTSQILATIFPQLAAFDADFNVVDGSDQDLDKKVAETTALYEQLKLTAQILELTREVAQFKAMRKTLRFCKESGLVRRDSLIPNRYLADIFMACPVWFFALKTDELGRADDSWQKRDPQVSPTVMDFCDLFPNERWYHTFQMFNRRVRPLSMYSGEMIPPSVARMLSSATEAFDHVVIATPYHDLAGLEWQSPEWQRAIDPFVLGFKKGLPFFVVLARYSGTGVFPLLPELVADTTNFLRTNKDKLMGFGDRNTSSPYWYDGRRNPDYSLHEAGPTLIRHTDELLTAFEAGHLFDWLRGETDIVK